MGDLVHKLAYDRIIDLVTDPVRNDATFTQTEVAVWVLAEIRKQYPTFSPQGHILHWDYLRKEIAEQNRLWVFPLSEYYFSQQRIDDIRNGVDERIVHHRSCAGLNSGRTYGYVIVTHRADLGLVLTKLVRKKVTINGSARALDGNADNTSQHLPLNPAHKAVIKRGLNTLRLQNGSPKSLKP